MSTSPIKNSATQVIRPKSTKKPPDPTSEETAVTVKDIANLAGVSVATVSRVTNDSGSVSCDTRDRVLSAISRLRYRPNAYAAQLARRSNGISRNGKPRSHMLTQNSLSPLPEKFTSRHPPGLSEAEKLRRLELENLQLKRQLSALTSDLARWKQLTQPESE